MSQSTLTKNSIPRHESRSRFDLARYLPWLIAGASLVINWATARLSNFDGLYGQDAYAYFAHAAELYNHASLFHQWQWDIAPRLLYWPMGYPALAALLFVVAGVTAQAAQLVSILALALTAGLTTHLGLLGAGFLAFSSKVENSIHETGLQSELKASQSSLLSGLFAGGAVALSPLTRQAGLSVMADATALALITLAFWLVVMARLKQNNLVLVLAGPVLALAASTRYAALIIIPALVWLIWTMVWNNKRFEGKTSTKSPEIGRAAVVALVALGLAAIPQALINLAWPTPFWGHQWLTGWSPLNFGRTVFDTPDGHSAYSRPPLIFYGLEPLWNLRFLTPLVIPLVLIGLISLWLNRRGNWLGGALLIWWLITVLFYSGIPYENERFTLSFLPPVAVVAGLGLATLYQWAAKTFKFKFSFVAGLLITLLGLGGLGWAGQVHMQGFFAFKQSELETAQAVERRLPANARLITFGISLTFDHYYPARPVYDLSALDENRLKELVAQSGPLYLLVEAEVLEQQFVATPIGLNYQAARAKAIEPPVFQRGRYRLWKLTEAALAGAT